MAKRTTKKASKKKSKGFNLKDERIPKVLSIVCLLLSVYLFIAFISYFFTWKFDQSAVLKFSGQLLFENEIIVRNWLGRLGAIISNAFFYWGFGIPSFGFILILLRLARDLAKRIPLSGFFEFSKNVILTVAFLSILMEFIFNNSSFSWGGAFGESTNIWLTNFLGRIGLALLMFCVLASSFMWLYNPSLSINLPDNKYFKMPALSFPNFNAAPTQSKPRGKKQKNTPSEDLGVETLRPGQRDTDFELGAFPKTDTDSSGSLSSSKMEFKLPEVFQKKKKPNVLKPEDDALEISVNENLSAPKNTPLEKVDVKPGNHADGEKLIIEQENETNSDPYDPTLDLSGYKFPTIDLLIDYSDQKVEVNREELEANKDQIIETLLNYKIEITKIRATIGPTVTLYEIVPAPGVKISKIKNLEDDIALSLAALGIRIIAPIPGKGTIGIEVPNQKKQTVSFKEVINSDKFKNSKMDLPIALGKTISNEVFVADLAKMPHLLVAGATGQGKSVGINTILMSILYKKHPSQVKLVLIDPKKVELFPYSQIEKHYLAFLPDAEESIITDTQKVIHTLNSLTVEMDTRYDLLKKAKSRNIKEYNAKFVARKLNPNNGHKFMPFIVLVVDEFADLIMTAGKEVEIPIARIAQLARAVGIHLIIATQRPSVNIITGSIKANFPARIAFKVTSKIDSRTILDQGGAEQLIGRGDMLLSVGSTAIRLQCAFVDTPEVERIVEHIGNQQGFPEPFFLPEVKGEDDISSDGSNLKASDLDENFYDAARLVVGNQHGSTSMIQRKMQLGYNRAGRVMDQLEAVGIVGPARGSKPREVYVHTEAELNQILQRFS